MKVATFNVNNVNKRLTNLIAWLRAAKPDVVCLQELKAADREFPKIPIEKAGYGVVWRGQKSWNGVAILARGTEPIVTRTELPGDAGDIEARYIEAAVNGVLIASLYAPNGNPRPGPKFTYKLAWMDRLAVHAAELFAAGVPVVLAGDYNVVPTDRDIYQTKSYDKDALVQPESRARFRRILDQGWRDAVRMLHRDAPMYTYWSYLRNRWPRDAGLRIDHLLLSREAAKRLVAASVDRAVRGKDNASDHAPVWVELRDDHLGLAPRTRRAGPNSRERQNVSSELAAPKINKQSPRTPKAMPGPLLVIDGDSFAHRAYHALPKNIRRKGDLPAGAILGFANFLLRLHREERPRGARRLGHLRGANLSPPGISRLSERPGIRR
jgi:exodeoxyribonuclease III